MRAVIDIIRYGAMSLAGAVSIVLIIVDMCAESYKLPSVFDKFMGYSIVAMEVAICAGLIYLGIYGVCTSIKRMRRPETAERS